MRLFSLATFGLAAVLALSSCAALKKPSVEKAVDSVNVIDAANLTDIMMTVADPNEAVNYFQRSLQKEPNRIDFTRGLANL